MQIKHTFLAGTLALTLAHGTAPANSRLPPPGGTAAQRAEAREIYSRIIAMQTVVGRRQVPQMAEYLAGLFRTAGFAQGDVQTLPFGETAALVVRYRGRRASAKKPILLLAHMDVVDALPQDWSYDPFKLTEEGGYFYGRGTSDDKQGVAALTAMFLRLEAEHYVPNRDLIIAFTGDEETKMATAHALATQWHDLIDAEFALNTDAGYGAFDRSGKNLGFAFVPAEKTSTTFAVTVRNPGGHSARPRDDNAIYQLAAALVKLAAYHFEPMITDTTRAYFIEVSKQYSGDVADAMLRFARDPTDRAAADRIERQPGEIGTTRTTCVATMLTGGHAFNALPQSATATVNCRVFPGMSSEQVEQILRQVVADPAVEFRVSDQKTTAPGSPLRKDILEAYAHAVHVRFPEAPIIPRMLSGMTDGSEFRAFGIPTYGVDGSWVVVPDDLRLHGRDERLATDAFYANVDHWVHMVKELSGGKAVSAQESRHRAQ